MKPFGSVSAPRGLLKLLIIKAASRAPKNGMELANEISQLTSGIWKPSPGSIYYILRGLNSNGLLKSVPTKKRRIRRYFATEKGVQYLARFQESYVDAMKKNLMLSRITAQLADDHITSGLIELGIQSLRKPRGDIRDMDRELDQLLKVLRESSTTTR